MATYQKRDGRWRAIIRKKGSPTESRTFPTKTLARAWAERREREIEQERAERMEAPRKSTDAA